MKNIILIIGFFLAAMSFPNAQTTFNGSFVHNGINRTYSYYIPASYTPGENVPLLIGLHGLSSSGSDFAEYRDFRRIADTANFIVVNPDGSSLLGVRFWNYGGLGSTVDDVDFLEALIDSLSAYYSINQQKIYCTGMSNGSFMAYKLACESNRFAAIAAVTGSMSVTMYNNCNPSRPIPILHIHGTNDNVNPYTGTSSMKGIEEVISFWVGQNNCNPTPAVSQIPDLVPTDNATAERFLYSGGTNGNTVELFKIHGGGHSWPGSPLPGSNEVICMDFDAREEIWRFLNQFEKDQPNALNDRISDLSLIIYPNPTQGILNIHSEILIIDEIIILDMQGRIMQSHIRAPLQFIDISHLPSGNYFLRISGNKFSTIRKLVILPH